VDTLLRVEGDLIKMPVAAAAGRGLDLFDPCCLEHLLTIAFAAFLFLLLLLFSTAVLALAIWTMRGRGLITIGRIALDAPIQFF